LIEESCSSIFNQVAGEAVWIKILLAFACEPTVKVSAADNTSEPQSTEACYCRRGVTTRRPNLNNDAMGERLDFFALPLAVRANYHDLRC